jgi:general secretion pathway protein H
VLLARSGRGARGFTLIEILVVVLIIGIVTAGIVLSVNVAGRDNELEKESTRLVELLKYAHEQAELQTRDFGVLFRENGYEFLTYDPRRGIWRDVYEDDALRDRVLPAGLGVRLTLEGRPVVFKPVTKVEDKTPQVMIFANGDLSSFEVTLEREGGVRSITVAQDDKGQIMERPMVEAKS